MLKITEKQFLQQVTELCRLLGYDYYHTWKSIHSPAGYPDLTIVKSPRLIFVELKIGKAKLTIFQEKWMQYFRDCGVEAYVWRDTMWEEIVECLKR